MKQKIIKLVFTLLIILTAVCTVIIAIGLYTDDINNYNEDTWIGFASVVTVFVGGFIVIYELDLFYTVYYFLIKPKTKIKSILNIISNLTLLLIFFTDSISHFLFRYVSEIFGEEIFLLIAFFGIYIISRLICAALPYNNTEKTD